MDLTNSYSSNSSNQPFLADHSESRRRYECTTSTESIGRPKIRINLPSSKTSKTEEKSSHSVDNLEEIEKRLDTFYHKKCSFMGIPFREKQDIYVRLMEMKRTDDSYNRVLKKFTFHFVAFAPLAQRLEITPIDYESGQYEKF